MSSRESLSSHCLSPEGTVLCRRRLRCLQFLQEEIAAFCSKSIPHGGVARAAWASDVQNFAQHGCSNHVFVSVSASV